jgi:phosphoribosyl 1,2-cyclic phosphodiesterase
MSVFITSLASGSNGNCYYIGNAEAAVLVDAGISCRETVKRMKRLGLAMDKVKAVFISHEHVDHISGLEQLSKQFSIPVYITEATLRGSALKIEKHLTIPFQAFKPVAFGSLHVTAFPKYHDAVDAHSFIVQCGNVTIGIFTDIGICCDNVKKHFSMCDAAFLEANYDVGMLANGGYPFHLKKRISGGNGHLSNLQALELFTNHRPAFMGHLILSHLSKNNNKPEIVQALFDQYAGNTKIVVASRFEETPVFNITHVHKAPAKAVKTYVQPKPRPQQLSLFQ